MPDHDEHDDGSVIEVDGRRRLRFVRTFATDRQDLWSAITDSDRMGRWAFAGSIEPLVGGVVRFDFNEAGSVEGKVLVYDEPAVLEYEWVEGDGTWHIRFELVSDGADSTTLTFDHFLPDPTRPDFGAGWHWHLDRLEQHLRGDQPADVLEDAHFHALMEHYATES